MLRIHIFALVFSFLIVFSHVGLCQQASTSESNLVEDRHLRFVYVSDEKRLQLATISQSVHQDLLLIDESALTTLVKSFVGIQLDFLVSPAPFRDKIACFVINPKIGIDEQKLVIVDTTDNNVVELGTYKIKFKTEKKPGTFSSDPRNFVVVRNFRRPQWSPDGKRILIASSNGLFIVDVATHQNIRFGQSKGIKEAIWSRNGAEIYFTDGKDLFSISGDGSNEQKMPKPEGHWKDKANLVLSSDGNKLIFSNGFRIYTFNLDTNAYTELLKGKTEIYAIEMVPNSEKLVCSIGSVDNFDLAVFDSQTMKKVKLKKWNASGADLVSPSVSPNGQFVLFSMRELNGRQQIYLANIGKNEIIRTTKKDDNTYPCFWR